jgi:hypothetical protein
VKWREDYSKIQLTTYINCLKILICAMGKQDNWIKDDNHLRSNFKLKYVYTWQDFHPTIDTTIYCKHVTLLSNVLLHILAYFCFVCFTVVYFQVLSLMFKNNRMWHLDMNDFSENRYSGKTWDLIDNYSD